MAQLGAGLVGFGQQSYPTVIDDHQYYVNGSTALPDSNTRLDAELMMDILRTLIALETTLGANVQGDFGSVAARLNQFLPGGGGTPGVFPFTNALTYTVPGAVHNVGQAALLWQLYDTQIPANAMAPGAAQVGLNPSTYDVTLTFAIPTSGSIALGATSPLYLTTFTNVTTVSVPGTIHQLPSADMLFAVYDATTPVHNAIQPGSFTVHQTSGDVTMTFITPTSGTLILSAGGPVYAVNFNLTTPPYTLSIPGTLHQLGTPALLFQFYDMSTPMQAMAPGGVQVHPTTFDITITFSVPLSGRVVFMAATTFSGRDIDIRDSGIVNQTAVRMRSQNGALLLQSGGNGRIYLLNATGQAVAVFNTQSLQGHFGMGIDTTHQLEITSGDAVKAGGGAWLAPSATALKEAITPFEEGLDTLLKLAPVSYRYKPVPERRPDPQRYVGLLGEDAEQASTALVQRHRPPGTAADTPEQLLLDATPLLYMLINAVKTLHGDLVDAREGQQRLEHQIAMLADQLLAMDDRLLALEPPETSEAPEEETPAP